MVVLEPLKVNLVNLVKDVSYEIAVPEFPDAPEKGSHQICFGQTVYIERSDFKEVNEKGYRRLAPEQPVGLKHAGYVIRVVKVHKDGSGQVKEIDAEAISTDKIEDKPKAFIHWVSDPIEIQVRLYERLFKHKNPEDPVEVPGGFLTDVNENSKTVVKAMADRSLAGVNVYDRFQFERVGFFSVDPDSSKENIVFNRTVSLKEDSKKV